MRTYLVVGACSEIRDAVVTRIQKLGDVAFLIDTCGGDVLLDFSTTESRLKVIEGVLKATSGRFDAIISTNNITANKPIAISTNFFGITQFIEGLYEEIADGSSPRICILNFYDEASEYSIDLVELMLHSDEKTTLRLAQELIDETSVLPPDFYASSQKAINEWVQQVAHKLHWRQPGILINTVAVDTPYVVEDLAELIVWIASPLNRTYSGQILQAHEEINMNFCRN